MLVDVHPISRPWNFLFGAVVGNSGVLSASPGSFRFGFLSGAPRSAPQIGLIPFDKRQASAALGPLRCHYPTQRTRSLALVISPCARATRFLRFFPFGRLFCTSYFPFLFLPFFVPSDGCGVKMK